MFIKSSLSLVRNFRPKRSQIFYTRFGLVRLNFSNYFLSAECNLALHNSLLSLLHSEIVLGKKWIFKHLQ